MHQANWNFDVDVLATEKIVWIIVNGSRQKSMLLLRAFWREVVFLIIITYTRRHLSMHFFMQRQRRTLHSSPWTAILFWTWFSHTRKRHW